MSGRITGALRPGNIIVTVLLIAVLVAGALLVTKEPEVVAQAPVATSATAPVPEIAAPASVSALWVGDSFTAGVNGAGKAAYAQIVCQRFGWSCNVDAQGSTGFLNDGAAEYNGTTTRIGNRLEFDKATYKADIVLIDGGRNDLNQSAALVGPVMDTYIREVRAAWPNAKLVIIVPAYMSSEPYEIYSDLLDFIDTTAQDVNATVIDPVAEGWYDTADVASMQIDDGVHPNAVGNAFIAGVLERSLVDKGVVPAPTGGTP